MAPNVEQIYRIPEDVATRWPALMQDHGLIVNLTRADAVKFSYFEGGLPAGLVSSSLGGYAVFVASGRVVRKGDELIGGYFLPFGEGVFAAVNFRATAEKTALVERVSAIVKESGGALVATRP